MVLARRVRRPARTAGLEQAANVICGLHEKVRLEEKLQSNIERGSASRYDMSKSTGQVV